MELEWIGVRFVVFCKLQWENLLVEMVVSVKWNFDGVTRGGDCFCIFVLISYFLVVAWISSARLQFFGQYSLNTQIRIGIIWYANTFFLDLSFFLLFVFLKSVCYHNLQAFISWVVSCLWCRLNYNYLGRDKECFPLRKLYLMIPFKKLDAFVLDFFVKIK